MGRRLSWYHPILRKPLFSPHASLTQKYASVSRSCSGVAPVSCVKAHTSRFLSGSHQLQSFPSMLYFNIIMLFTEKVNGFEKISAKTAHIIPYNFKILRFFSFTASSSALYSLYSSLCSRISFMSFIHLG